MDINKFTIKSQEVVQKAQQLAQMHGNQAIENGHLMEALLNEDNQVIEFILKKQGVNIDYLKKELEKIINTYAKVTG
ncbi:Clp protease N-terminal domain-containing protein, partial [Ornithobacterium rhinotracheale]